MEVAIIAALGGIVGGISDMVSSGNLKKAKYQEWLNSALPEYTNAFDQYRTAQSPTNLYIMSIIGALILLTIIAIIVKN